MINYIIDVWLKHTEQENMYVRELIELVTDDYNGNTFDFIIHEKDGLFNLTGKTVKLLVISPSGAIIMNDCSSINLAESKASIILPSDMFSEGGKYQAEVQIYQGTKRVTSLPFDYTVRLSLESTEAVIADNRFSLLQQALQDVSTAQTQAASALSNANAANTAANTAVTTINNQIANINNTATTVNTLKTTVESMIANMDRVVEEELPPVSSRIAGVFYWKYYVENGVRKIAWVEDYLGNKYDIHDYPSKIISMLPDGTFPVTKCANHFLKGLTIKGQTIKNIITKPMLNQFKLDGTKSAYMGFDAYFGESSFSIEAGKTYTLYMNITRFVASIGYIRVACKNQTGTNIYATEQIKPTSVGIYKLKFTAPSGAIKTFALGGANMTADNYNYDCDNVMIIDGDVPNVNGFFTGLSSTGDLDIQSNPLRILPNGVRDEITNPITGLVTRRAAVHIIQASDIRLLTEYINLNIITILKKPDNVLYNVSTRNLETAQTMTIEGFNIKNGLSADDPSYTNTYYNASTDNIGILVPKLKYLTLADAQKDKSQGGLVGLKITYQLATPIQETYDTSLFKTYILCEVNGVMQRVKVSDYLRKVVAKDECINGILTRSMEKVIFNGVEGWTLQSINAYNVANFYRTPTVAIRSVDVSQSPIIMTCDKFKIQTTAISATIDEGVCSVGPLIYLRISSAKLTTPDANGLSIWLGSNNVTVVYEKATPTYEQIDITSIQTIQGDNTIKYMGAVVPSEMTATVCQTNEQVKEEQDARLTALENLALL